MLEDLSCCFKVSNLEVRSWGCEMKQDGVWDNFGRSIMCMLRRESTCVGVGYIFMHLCRNKEHQCRDKVLPACDHVIACVSWYMHTLSLSQSDEGEQLQVLKVCDGV